MFLARVLMGNFKEMDPTKGLKAPPFIENSNETKYYDGVKGRLQGSMVYMIYTNRKAYPEYLITYKHR